MPLAAVYKARIMVAPLSLANSYQLTANSSLLRQTAFRVRFPELPIQSPFS
jgi:hypothetical protein